MVALWVVPWLRSEPSPRGTESQGRLFSTWHRDCWLGKYKQAGSLLDRSLETRRVSGRTPEVFNASPQSTDTFPSLPTLVVPPRLMPPETADAHRPPAPLLHSCPPRVMASRGLTVRVSGFSAWLWAGPPQPLFPCLDHCSSCFCDCVFTCWFGGCITPSWLLALDPVLVKPLRVCSGTRSRSASFLLSPLLGSWCLCSRA